MVSATRTKILKVLLANILIKRAKKRRFWIHPLNQQRNNVGEHLKIEEMYAKYPDKFFQYTRLTPNLFDKLISIVGPFIEKSRSNFREPISTRSRLFILLRFLATGDSLRTISTSFSVGASTVWKIVTFDLSLIWLKLRQKYVKCPTADDWTQISNDFERRWNYPNCIGAVDGKHVVITAPKKSGSLYLNYKGTFSIILMASCDARYKFTSVDVGAFGKQSDGGVFGRSQLGRKLNSGTLDIPLPRVLPNTNTKMNFHFIGDEAFPLSLFMMRPFPGATLNDQRRIYNYRLSRARRCIENSFGIMAARFRIFRRPIPFQPKTVEQIVLAAVGLHNFILTEEEALPVSQRMYCPSGFADANDLPNGNWRTSDPSHALSDVRFLSTAAHERFSKQMREDLVNYFNNSGRVDFQNERAGIA